jgi:hypothetical protein
MTRRLCFALLLSVTLLCLLSTQLATAQQPRVQGPAPADCPQALRENNAYRDRIASLERQVDATNEDAKTWYIRAAHLEELAADQDRLVNRYREELFYTRARLERAEHLLERRALPEGRRRRPPRR